MFKLSSLLLGAYILLIISKFNESKIIKPSSSAELQSALDSAASGDTIQMLPMTYKGDFTINSNGPATLTGDFNSTIESEGVGIHLKGSDWKLKAFWVRGPAKGVIVEGKNNMLEGVVLQGTGQAIVVKGEENTVKSCVISEAELGIILEGSRNKLYYNSVNIQTPAIIIPKDSCCGLLDGNVANGEMKIEGSNYKFNGNVANHGLYVSGCNNEFSGNVANGASFPKECMSIDLGGNVYRGLGPGDTDLPTPNNQQKNNYYGENNNNMFENLMSSMFGNMNYMNNAYAQNQPNSQMSMNPFLQTQNMNKLHSHNMNNQGSFNMRNNGQSQNNGQSVPVQVQGNGPPPKCSCSCSY